MEKFLNSQKNKIATILFYTAFILEIVIVCMANAGHHLPYEGRLMQLAGLIFGIKILLTKYSRKEWLFLIPIGVLTCIPVLTIHETGILQIFLMITASKDINREKALKFYFYLCLTAMLLMAILSGIGILDNFIQIRDFDRGGVETRYCFGFNHPNVFYSNLLNITAIGILVYFRYLNSIHYLLLTISNVILYMLTVSRTGFITVQFLIILAFVFYKWPAFVKNKWMYRLGYVEIASVVLISWGFVLLGNPVENKLDRIVNQLLTGRIMLAQINAPGETWTLFPQRTVNGVVDMGYIKVIASWGIVLGLVYIGIIAWNHARLWKKSDFVSVIVLMTYTLFTMIESHAFSMYFVGNLMFLIMIGWEKRKMHSIQKKSGQLVAGAIFLVVVVMNVILCFEERVWGDEAWSLNLAMHSLGELLKLTAAGEHPPLYYILLKIAYMVGGQNALWMLRLLSLLPVVILNAFILHAIQTKQWKVCNVFSEKDRVFISVAITVFLGLGQRNIEKNIELRMYTWALLFVSLTVFSAIVIYMKDFDSWKSFVCMSIWGLLAAYTHYWALITVAWIYIVMTVYFAVAREKSRFIKMMAVGAISILGYLPWLPAVAGNMQIRSTQGWWVKDVGFNNIGLTFRWFYESGNQITEWCFLLLYIGTLVGSIVALCTEKDNNVKKLLRVMLGLLLLPLCLIVTGIFMSEIWMPCWIDRFAFPTSCSLYMGIILVICYWSKKIKFGFIGKIGLLSFIFVCGIAKYEQYYQKLFDQAVILEKKEISQEFSKIVVVTTDVDEYIKKMNYGYVNYFYPAIPKIDETEIITLNGNEKGILFVSYEKMLDMETFERKYELMGYSVVKDLFKENVGEPRMILLKPIK